MIMLANFIMDKRAAPQKHRPQIVATCMVLFLFLSSGICYAGGLESKGVGPRNLGMGAAGIGLADSWTALYWNPAGLANLSGNQIGFNFNYMPLHQESSHSLSNWKDPTVANQTLGEFPPYYPSVEPYYFNEKNVDILLVVPELGWVKNYGRYSVGFGMYGSAGAGTDWHDNIILTDGSELKADVEVAIFSIKVPVAVAVKITDKLAAGFNFSLVYTKQQNKAYKSVTASPSAGYTNIETIFETDSDGYGMAADMGLMYEIRDNLTAGCIVHFPFQTTSEGKAHFFSTPLTPLMSETKTEGSMYTPWKFGVGLAYRPRKNITLVLDTYFVQHSGYEWKTYYKNKDSFQYNSMGGGDFVLYEMKDTLQFMLGAEYVLNDKWSFRLGFYTDPSAMDDASVSLMTPRNNDVYVPTAGIGYKWRNFEIDFSYIYGFAVDRKIPFTGPNGGQEVFSITGTNVFYGLGITYNFKEKKKGVCPQCGSKCP